MSANTCTPGCSSFSAGVTPPANPYTLIPAVTPAATPDGLSSNNSSASGLDADGRGRMQEKIWCRLAVDNVFSAEDASFEAVVKTN